MRCARKPTKKAHVQVTSSVCSLFSKSPNHNDVELVFNNRLRYLPVGFQHGKRFRLSDRITIGDGAYILPQSIVPKHRKRQLTAIKTGRYLETRLVHELEKHIQKYNISTIIERITELFNEEKVEVTREIQFEEQQMKKERENRTRKSKKPASEKELEERETKLKKSYGR